MPEPGLWPRAVLDLLEAAGARTVFEHGDRHVSGTEMLALIRRAATGLRRDGIGPGDGVVLTLGVHPEAFAAVFAAFTVGARVAGARPDQLADVLPTADATLIDENRLATLLDTPFLAGAPAHVQAGTPGQAHTDTRDHVGPAEPTSAPDAPANPEVAGGPSLPSSPGLPDPGDEPLPVTGRPEDPARVIYTSGSTGTPKGCVQTYASMTRAWAAHPDRWPPAIRRLAAAMDRYLVFGSLTSQVMLEYGVLALAAGGTLVTARPPGFPGAIARHRATASVITVGKLHQLVRDQRASPADLSSLRALMVSGSPLDQGRLEEAMDVLGPVIFHGYGQTETGMIAMVTPEEMLASPAALASVGRPPDTVNIRIRGGELFVRTPAQASSYWRDPDETAQVFADGWVRTRDLATVDDEGYLRLLGRTRDVIFVHAELVHAGPIERTLAAHPDVAEAYVVARPDDETGEAVHAFVVPAAQRVPDTSELRALFSGAAVPKTITIIDRVPLTAAGKPDKSAL